MKIRKAIESDLNDVLKVEQDAFGAEEGPIIVSLVKALLDDPSAKPVLSLLAFDNEQVIGHVLFTGAHLNHVDDSAQAAILAPLAVIPERQNQGAGGQLIKTGLQMLSEAGTELVFVLGYPDYYNRYGFSPAGVQGFEAPYPILDKNADAWMVQELRDGAIDELAGKIVCAEALNKPEYWRE